MKKKLHVLIMEDSQDDAELNVRLLQTAGYDITWQRVETAEEMTEALEKETWDLILSDYSMPQFRVQDAIEIYYAHCADIPFIVISGAIGEEKAVQLIKAGVHDYLLKDNMSRFIPVVERELREATTRRELISTHTALVASEEKFRSYIENAPDGIFVADETGKYIAVNEAACRITGYSKDELLKMSISDLTPEESRQDGLNQFNKVVETGFSKGDLLFKHKNGTARWWSVEAVKLSETRFLGFTKDITEGKQTEEDLRSANNFMDLIVEHIPNMIFLKDANTFRFIKLNQAGEDLLGISREELVGKNDYDFFPKEQADSFIENDREVMRSGAMLDIPGELIQTKNHGIRTLHTKKVPIFNHLGGPEYLLGISEDITELKIAEHALKVSEEKYKTMLRASPDGIFLIDLKGIVSEVSDIGLELLGMDAKDDLLGKNFYLFVPSDEIKTVRVIIERTINDGLIQNVGLKIRKNDRSLFAAEASATLIQDLSGAPVFIMVILRDISLRQIAEAKQYHADRMANLGQMASGIAHEINQPLNIISIVMDKILFEIDKNKTIDIEFLKRKSSKIFDNINRMKNIIDHIRVFSRSQNDYVSTNFDINSSIENAVSMIMEHFKHLGINLNLQLEKEIPQKFGNTYKFEQVILNLLVNAKDAVVERKSKQQKYVEMNIGIKSYQENQYSIVEITDNGIGINDDDLHNVMLPFYTTKEEGKGTGLGLSICYQIIKEMDGDIKILSNRMDGTKIKIILESQMKK